LLKDIYSVGVTQAGGWVLGDSMYGSDKTLRVMLEERDKPYVLGVRCNEKLMMLPAILHTCKLGYQLNFLLPSGDRVD